MKLRKSISDLWEERSKEYGIKPEGVLPKFLPRVLNDYLDWWMYKQLSSKLKAQSSKLKILDLGCGYGRLSGHILKDFGQIKTFGIDISRRYVELYNRNLNPRGKALFGDLKKIPFPDQSFDFIFMVTALMYITHKNDQKTVMREIFRVLKPQGHFVIIERNPVGQGIVTLGGIITKIRGKKHHEIPSVSFTKGYMTWLVKTSGGIIGHFSGMPFFTLLLPFLIITSFLNRALALKLVKFISFLDRRLNGLLTPSLYISYSGIKR